MPQVPFAARVTNFMRDANNGLESPAPLGVDAELNALINVVNQAVLRLRGVTESDGTLVNFASATAQALAGTQDITATAAQTAFVTTIVWTAAFTSANVFVFVNNVKLATSAVAVADDGSGFLEVTVAAQDAGNVVTIAAFESGAGLLSRLQTISATEGASLIAINDAGGFFSAVQVEAALQELATDAAALTTAVGNTADLIRRTGTVPFTANQSMGGFKLTNLADGVSAQDAVTVNQFNAYTAVWNALQSYFMRLDGTTPMAAALPMGNNKITGLANGTVSTDAVNKGQLDLMLPLAGGTMTGVLNMGSQRITALADPTAETDAINLRTARTITAAFASRAQFTAAGTSAWVVPAGVTKARIRVWGGGGGGSSAGSATLGYGGGGGAYAEATLTVVPAESITVIVGAGAAAQATGGNSQVLRGATALITANGGVRGDTTGLGGSYSFDASVTGLGINGGAGEAFYINTASTDPVQHVGANGGASPCGGPGGRRVLFIFGTGQVGTGGQGGEAPGGGGAGYVGAGSAGAAGRVEIEF